MYLKHYCNTSSKCENLQYKKRKLNVQINDSFDLVKILGILFTNNLQNSTTYN